MTLITDGSGNASGTFTIPANIPTGAKLVEAVGSEGSRALAIFDAQNRELVRTVRRIRSRPVDPVAQTFRLEQSRWVTAISVQFAAKGSNSNPVILEIRETDLGLPTAIALAEGSIAGSSITTSGWTKISLTRPTWLQAGEEYAFVLLTDDQVHAVRIAELGQRDADGDFVTRQPFSVGTLLLSSNASTWTPKQEADLAFRIHGARFTSSTRTVDLGPCKVMNATSITRSGGTATVTATAHPFLTGDKVVISGADQSDYNGAFTITKTGANTFTYTVANSPATPATGTILLAPGNVSDLIALANILTPTPTARVEFAFVKPDTSEIRAWTGEPVNLAERLDVPLTLKALLSGNDIEGPMLEAGTQAMLGNLQGTGTYVSRAFPCQANARVSVTYEALLPAASSIVVEVQKGDDSWQTQAVTTSAAVGDGWVEYSHVIASFTAGGTTARVRLTLTGTAAARPQVRDLRVAVT